MGWNPFRRQSPPGHEEMVLGLREMWLNDKPGTGQTIAAMDWGVGGTHATLVAAAGGGASFYVLKGASFIGLEGVPEVAAAARNFVEVARGHRQLMRPVTEWPLAGQGQMAFRLRLDGVVHSATVEESALGEHHPLQALADAAQQVITALRLHDARRRERGSADS